LRPQEVVEPFRVGQHRAEGLPGGPAALPMGAPNARPLFQRALGSMRVFGPSTGVRTRP